MKNNYYRLLLVLIVLAMCLIRFGHVYYDSIQYIWFTQYFAGVGSISIDPMATVLDEFVVRAPFVYRPLLSFITALFYGGFDVVFVMSVINVVALCVMVDMVFNICNTLTLNQNMAFLGAAITAASYPLAFYGPVPLTDAFGMLCFVGLIGCMESNYGDECAALIVFIGVFVKEIILILGLFYIIRGGLKKIWVLIPGAVAALSLRVFIGMRNTMIFNLEILTRPIEVLMIFGATFAIPVIIILYHWWKKDFGTERGRKIFIAGLVAGIPLVILGLFFAYFDGRFLWPLLITTGMYVSTLRG